MQILDLCLFPSMYQILPLVIKKAGIPNPVLLNLKVKVNAEFRIRRYRIHKKFKDFEK